MKLGFIGLGEAGFSIANGLKDEGIKNIKAFDITIDNENLKPLLIKRAKIADVTLVKRQEDIFKCCDVIFSAVPAKYALAIVKDSEEMFREGMLYIDLSTAEPTEKKHMEQIANNKGAFYVDAAMFGRLSINKHEVPIYASGSGVDYFIDRMEPYNMNIKNIGEEAGDATSIKLIRSIFMKGYAALSIELLETAKYIGVEDHIIESIGNSLDDSSFQQNINNFVTGTAIHAERREGELKSSLKLLKSLNLDSTMTEAVASKLKYVSDLELKEAYEGIPPKDWSKVIDDILKNPILNQK